MLEDEQKLSNGGMLALLKYPFYYTIRRGFGNFSGMIHVLTRHLAPELDRFRFCPGFVFYQNHRPELPIYTPKPPSKRESGDRREIQKRASRDEFQISIRVGHKRKATPEASSSLGAAASWRTARDPSLAGYFTTMIDYASLSFMG